MARYMTDKEREALAEFENELLDSLKKLRDMSNEKELVGWELVNFLMQRWNMTEDEALQSLAENIGNVKKVDKKVDTH